MEEHPTRWWYALLALPFLGLLYPPLYASRDPELAGIPFFYWYQFAWVIVPRRSHARRLPADEAAMRRSR